MEEKLDSARHRDSSAERWSKTPVARRLNGSSVEGRVHAMHDPDSGDVPLGIDIDVHGYVSARAAGGCFWRVGGLLLLKHLRRHDYGCCCILRTGASRRCDQGAESENEKRPATERPRKIATMTMDTEWEHEISSIRPTNEEHEGC